MKSFSVLLLLAMITLTRCSSTQDNTGSVDHTWHDLLGKNSRGWHRYGGGKIDSAWKIDNGILALDVAAKKNLKGSWDIVTDEEYGDFELQLDWKIAKDGNSGIMFYVNEDKTKYNWPWETGPEMQVLDNDGHPDGKIEKHHAGDLFDIMAGTNNRVNPVGEWNSAGIRSEKGQLEFTLNGQSILHTSLWDDQWKKIILNSKFRNMPGFGIYKTGRICLQDHGDAVWFRNIRIRRL